MYYTCNVRNIRQTRGISQSQMANDLEISVRNLRNIENGDTNTSLEMAYRIAAYFKLIVTEVFPVDS